MTNDAPPVSRALVLSFPSDDLAAARDLLDRSSLVLLPAGGVGDLALAAGIEVLLVIELTDDGPRSAVSWRGSLATSSPLTDDLRGLLPATWLTRHPDAYQRSRTSGVTHEAPDVDEGEDVDPTPTQIYLPVVSLTEVPRNEWIFTNELVPKQRRDGRRFAPRVPMLVELPDEL